jgi:hypothetical protein
MDDTQKKPEFKRGHLTNAELALIDAAAANLPVATDAAQVGEGLALAMNRRAETITEYIITARERFQSRDGRYADIHIEATEAALVKGDLAEARQGAQWALEKLAAKNSKGQTERIIEPANVAIGDGSGGAPIIQIGFAIMPKPEPSDR